MIFGQKIRLTYNGQTVDAVVELGSENRKSLIVVFDAALHDTRGGMFCGSMALLERDGYRNLMTGEPVEIEWL